MDDTLTEDYLDAEYAYKSLPSVLHSIRLVESFKKCKDSYQEDLHEGMSSSEDAKSIEIDPLLANDCLDLLDVLIDAIGDSEEADMVAVLQLAQSAQNRLEQAMIDAGYELSLADGEDSADENFESEDGDEGLDEEGKEIPF